MCQQEIAWNEVGNVQGAEDALQLYLREIGQVPLLSPARERELAEQVASGREAGQLLSSNDEVSPERRRELVYIWECGEAAREALIEANLRLVVSVARKYAASPLGLLDLVQEGNIGLLRAVERFDLRKGNRFSTYAIWWIRQAILRAIADQGRVIRLPAHLNESLIQLRRAIYGLEQSLGREPSSEEIAEAMGVSMSKLKRMLQAAVHPLSLDQAISAGSPIEEAIVDQVKMPSEIAVERMLEHDLHQALQELSDDQRSVIEMRYGLRDGRRRSRDEVAEELGMSRADVREAEVAALRNLRQPGVVGRLSSYRD